MIQNFLMVRPCCANRDDRSKLAGSDGRAERSCENGARSSAKGPGQHIGDLDGDVWLWCLVRVVEMFAR